MGKQKKSNRRPSEPEPLTPELLKTFKGFENISDEEALDRFLTIDALCQIVVGYLEHTNKPEVDSEQEGGIEAIAAKKKGRAKKSRKKKKVKANLCNPIAIKSIMPIRMRKKRGAPKW